jgi:hypothetical protein
MLDLFGSLRYYGLSWVTPPLDYKPQSIHHGLIPLRNEIVQGAVKQRSTSTIYILPRKKDPSSLLRDDRPRAAAVPLLLIPG